jgi:hypothetical protein
MGTLRFPHMMAPNTVHVLDRRPEQYRLNDTDVMVVKDFGIETMRELIAMHRDSSK